MKGSHRGHIFQYPHRLSGQSEFDRELKATSRVRFRFNRTAKCENILIFFTLTVPLFSVDFTKYSNRWCRPWQCRLTCDRRSRMIPSVGEETFSSATWLTRACLLHARSLPSVSRANWKEVSLRRCFCWFLVLLVHQNRDWTGLNLFEMLYN